VYQFQAHSQLGRSATFSAAKRTSALVGFIQRTSILLLLLILGLVTSGAAVAATLYFPRVQSDQTFETGLAISNTESNTGTATLSAYDSTGKLAGQVSLSLSALGQSAQTAKSLFGFNQDFIGWVRVDSTVEVYGFGLLVRRSDGLLSEVPSVRVPDGTQYLAHLAVGNGWQTEVAIANTSATACTAQIIAYGAQGSILATQSVALPALGHEIVSMQNVLGTAVLTGGHVEVFSLQPLVVAETFVGTNVLATVAGEGNVPPGSNGKWTLCYPNVTTASGYATGIAYVNQSGAPAFVTLTLLDQSGNAVVSQNGILEPKAQLAAGLSTLAQGWSGQGSLVITADSPISGLQIVATPAGNIFGWTAVRDAARELFVPHIAETGGWASTLSIVNPSPTAADVTLDAFDPAGNKLDTEHIAVQPWAQSTLAVGSMAGLAGQSGGSLRLTASGPIVAANAYQDSAGFASVVAAPASNVGSRYLPGYVVASATVTAAAGGSLSVPTGYDGIILGGLSLTVPSSSVAQDEAVQVAFTGPTMIDPDPTVQLVQYPIRLLPYGLRLSTPAKLTIPVNSAILAGAASSLAVANVACHDDLTNSWIGVPITARNTAAGTITAAPSSFGDCVVSVPRGGIAGQSATTSSLPLSRMRAADLSQLTTTGCDLNEQIGNVSALTGGSVDGITGLLDMLCTATAASSQWESGDTSDAITTIAGLDPESLEKDGIQVLCSTGVLFGTGTLAAFDVDDVLTACGAFASESVYVAEQTGLWIGNRYTDVILDENGAKWQQQLDRYIGWRKIVPTGAVPTCPVSGWYSDPALGYFLGTSLPNCLPADTIACNRATAPLLLLNPPSYPCNPLVPDDLYTPQAVAQFGDVLITEEPKLAQRAEALRDALLALNQQIASAGAQLTASFSVSPATTGTAPFPISVDASASTAQGTISLYSWRFGDGSTATGVNASHTYTTPGPYTITLTVADAAGNSVQTTNLVVVQAVPQTVVTSAPSAPVITAQTASITVPGSLAISGSGFLPRTPVTVSAVATIVGPSITSDPITTDGVGNLSYTIQFPASTPPGPYVVFAREQNSPATYSNNVNVTLTSRNAAPGANRVTPPSLTTASATQPATATLLVTGTGFQPQSFVSIRFANTASYGGVAHNAGDVAATITSAQVSSDGTSLVVLVSLYAGTYSLVVINPDGQSSGSLNLPVTQTSGVTLTFTPSVFNVSVNVGAGPQSGSVQIGASDGSAVSGSINVQGASWITFSGQSNSSFTTPAILPITVDPTGLQPGTYNASLLVTSTKAGIPPLTAPVTLRISQALQITSPSSLPGASVGQSYGYTLQATAGSGCSWQLASGSSMPTGLTLNGNSGVISGTPASSATGTNSFTIIVHDPQGNVASQAFTLVVSPNANGLVLSSISISPNTVVTGAFTTLSVSVNGLAPGGTQVLIQSSNAAAFPAPASITIPSGQSANSASVQVGSVAASTVVTVTASYGGVSYSATVTVNPGGGTNQIQVTPSAWQPVFTVGDPSATLPFNISAQNGATLNGTITASTTSGGTWLTVNGHPSDTWTTAPSGSTSESVSANPTGLSAGTYTGTVTVSAPAASNPLVTIPVTMTVRNALQIITTSPLPTATWGSQYSDQLLPVGANGTTWSLQGGSNLPSGLTLFSSGLITGTLPTTSNNQIFNFTVVLTDSNSGRSVTANLSLTVQTGISVTTYASSSFQFILGTAYVEPPNGNNSVTFLASGGTPPYAWTAIGLPTGLSLNPTSGVIVGTPSQAGTFPATITATDSTRRVGSLSFNVVVVASPLLITTGTGQTPATLPAGTVGTPYNQFLDAVGGSNSGYQWTVQGSLPLGLTAQTPSGCTPPTGCLQFAGTPTQAGTFPLTVQVKDSLNNTAQQSMSLIINSGTPPQISTTTLPLATVGQSYTTSFSASGGAGGYQWVILGGSPDPNLQLSAGGVLSGTSSTPNDCPSGPDLWVGTQYPSTYFQVQVTDSASQKASAQFCLPAYYPNPNITSVKPSSIVIDGQSHTITVGGSGIRSNAQLKAGYTSLTTAFNSGSLSTTLIPGSGGGVLGPLNEGTYALSIVQPYTYGSNSNYTFSIYDPAPTISSVTAVLNNTSQACTANLNCQLVINGSGLVYGTTYTIIETGTTLVKSVYPATPVPWTTVTTSAFSVATAGTYTLQIISGNQPGGGSASATAQFTVSP
jgi:PKD repeat protein